MTFVCNECKDQNHDNCDNVATSTDTWCDCQHRETEK